MVKLPAESAMRRAFANKDASFDGTFFVAVKTTGVFCRPVCRAKPPRAENIEFFASADEALRMGYRPCKLCRPLECAGGPPPLVERLMELVEKRSTSHLTGEALLSLGIDPAAARRQFRAFCNTTFAAYQRSRRMGTALKEINNGALVVDAQVESGFESASGFRAAFSRRFGRSAGRSAGMAVLTSCWIPSPVGPLIAIANDSGIVQLDFHDGKGIEREIAGVKKHFANSAGEAAIVPGEHPYLTQLASELDEYFAGRRMVFTTPLVPRGSDFQLRVWEYLRGIPYGQTRSYGDQARALGMPGAARAVGAANGQNCLAIVIPCHRVIGSGGHLTGYAGGLHRKEWLLNHERSHAGLFG